MIRLQNVLFLITKHNNIKFKIMSNLNRSFCIHKYYLKKLSDVLQRILFYYYFCIIFNNKMKKTNVTEGNDTILKHIKTNQQNKSTYIRYILFAFLLLTCLPPSSPSGSPTYHASSSVCSQLLRYNCPLYRMLSLAYG